MVQSTVGNRWQKVYCGLLLKLELCLTPPPAKNCIPADFSSRPFGPATFPLPFLGINKPYLTLTCIHSHPQISLSPPAAHRHFPAAAPHGPGDPTPAPASPRPLPPQPCPPPPASPAGDELILIVLLIKNHEIILPALTLRARPAATKRWVRLSGTHVFPPWGAQPGRNTGVASTTASKGERFARFFIFVPFLSEAGIS